MSNKFATFTITPDLSKFTAALDKMAREMAQMSRRTRAFGAYVNDMAELAKVIGEQPGRQIVRDGMADVLHWLGECECHTPCAYAKGRA